MLKFILYLTRWQLSTPVMTPIVAYIKHSPSLFGSLEDWGAIAIANLIGGAIFYWVDRFIFRSQAIEQWEILKYGNCYDCHKRGRLKRLVKAPGGYDRVGDLEPEYRCSACSQKKLHALRQAKKVAI